MDEPIWRKRRNRFKSLIEEGKPATAMWVTQPWPCVMEISGAYDVDAAFVDCEHTSFGLELVETMIVSAHLAGITPLVRPGRCDAEEVSRILDAGAQGILFPSIRTPDQAAAARQTLFYPPRGIRGWGGPHTHHALWDGPDATHVMRAAYPVDRGVYSKEYVEKAAADVMSIFLIETPEGVDNIDTILEAGQPDLVSFGWGDYSVAVEFNADACEAAAKVVYEACRSRDVGVSLPRADVPSLYYPGCYSVIGIDSLLMSKGIKAAVEGVREAFGALAV